MSLTLRHKKNRFTIQWCNGFSLKTGQDYSDEAEKALLPEFIRKDYDIVEGQRVSNTATGKILMPEGGWAELTLENFEEKMGYRFRMDHEQSMRGISREVAFLEFLESKGVKRQERLIEGLTLENFQEKVGHRFRMCKEDVKRDLSRERAFEEWKKHNGYSST